MTPEAKQNRSGFAAVLRGKLPRGTAPEAYARNLDSKIKRFHREKLNKTIDSLYEIKDENGIYQIMRDIAAHPTMVYPRGKGGDSKIRDLNLYLDYLNDPATTPIVVTAPSGAKRTIKRASPDLEGKHVKREVEIIQRNPGARRKCIEQFGCKCAACGLVMSDKYGPLGNGVIEVHHLNPIHLFDDMHPVDPLTDLVPLCPNCHTMIHRMADPGDIEGLKLLLEGNSA